MISRLSKILLVLCSLGASGAGFGKDVALAGVLGSKAALVVDGGAVRTLAVGQSTPDGVKLLEVSDTSAVIEVDGRRRTVVLGGGVVRVEGARSGGIVSLFADSKGHYFSSGSINGTGVRFLVDTGASMISMGVSDAQRAGIDYRRGVPGQAHTANGVARVWKVKLDKVQLGEISLTSIDALVHESELPFVLLGMTFLNRMDMQREGDRLILRKRY